jgi:hypothetical protein
MLYGCFWPVSSYLQVAIVSYIEVFLEHASAATGKEISVRDSSAFHIFMGGICSCREHRLVPEAPDQF